MSLIVPACSLSSLMDPEWMFSRLKKNTRKPTADLRETKLSSVSVRTCGSLGNKYLETAGVDSDGDEDDDGYDIYSSEQEI